MAHTLDLMDLKQILRLKIDGLSNRDIGSTLGIDRNCVNRYVGLFNGSEVSFEEFLSLDDATFRSLFPSSTTIDNERYDELMLYFEQVNHARNHSAPQDMLSCGTPTVCSNLLSLHPTIPPKTKIPYI
jgi:hypothetical protein